MERELKLPLRYSESTAAYYDANDELVSRREVISLVNTAAEHAREVERLRGLVRELRGYVLYLRWDSMTPRERSDFVAATDQLLEKP